MLYYGKNITQVDDPLQPVAIERIYRALLQPKPALRQQVERLRMVRAIDPKQYARLKRELPYFCCARFHPAFRRRENFAAIEYLVVDLDHLEAAGLTLAALRERLRADSRLLLSFASPGGDGLKLLYRLAERCHDAGEYALFYKAFITDLAVRYDLQALIDTRTHDVTRACFLSVDAEAEYRPDAEAVPLAAYFDGSDPEALGRVQQDLGELRDSQPAEVATTPAARLDDEVLTAIKQRLNPNFRPRPRREVFTPPQLDEVLEVVGQKLAENGIQLAGANAISYGKQLRVVSGCYWAEVNIFFGRRGYSVVKTTKTGSHAELAELTYQLLYDLLVHGDTP